jgi:nucleoside-diphosphate-sugar epimerase
MCALKVGIVGAAGQVGIALLSGINKGTGISAVGICRNSVSAARVAAQGLDVRTAQTDDPKQLAEVTQDLDALVNCALPQYRPSKTSASNRLLARALAEVCAGKHLVHLSSVAVYGDYIGSEKSRFQSPKPDTAYGRQKLQMEVLLRKYARKHSGRCTILRIGHVYGPELRWSESLFDLIQHHRFRLPFDGQQASNAVAISNLVEAVREVLLSMPAAPTLNLTNLPQITWRELFDLHSQACVGPFVESLRSSESEDYSRIYKKRARTGMLGRFVKETLGWIMQLPGSYIAAVPTLKTLAQQAVALVGNDGLDAKIWALYCRRLAPRIDGSSAAAVEPIFFSEPMPGPCVQYNGGTPTDLVPALRAWYDVTARQSCIGAGIH